MSYRETIVEESRKRAQEILGRIKTLKAELQANEAEYGQVVEVLRALKAEHQLGVQVEAQAHSILREETDTIIFELYGARNALKVKTIDAILAIDGVFRTTRVATEVAKEPDRQCSESSLHSTAGTYLAYLRSIGKVEKVGHGKYRVMRHDQKPKPEPKMRDRLVNDEPPLHIVNGTVTTESPPERGYGR